MNNGTTDQLLGSVTNSIDLEDLLTTTARSSNHAYAKVHQAAVFYFMQKVSTHALRFIE
jgi:hypothetical protein